MALIQSISKIYGMLLGLFPRDFQNEFKEEMEDVFTANLEEAAKTSAIFLIIPPDAHRCMGNANARYSPLWTPPLTATTMNCRPLTA